MPELPDVELYVLRLRERLVGSTLERFRPLTPFIVRSLGSASAFDGLEVVDVSRLGKRIVIEMEGDKFFVVHLMIAGRFQWQSPAPAPKLSGGKALLAMWRFSDGQLSLVEHSTKKRASIHLVKDRAGLDEHRRGGADIFRVSLAEFAARLKEPNRTVKRALTDPHSFDGIGNAYSDEILFRARLSPMRLTGSLSEEEVERLLGAARKEMASWTERLQELYPQFPKPGDVTAFRSDFAVHGRYGKPCPVCGSPVQHIVFSENEINYCARCQNEGKILADRSMSRLLKDDWPRTLEELES